MPEKFLVSRTVVDLTSGSGIRFDPRGSYDLKGIAGSWPLYAARVPEIEAPDDTGIRPGLTSAPRSPGWWGSSTLRDYRLS